MNKKLQQFIDKYAADEQMIDSIVVTTFANENHLNVGGFLKPYMLNQIPLDVLGVSISTMEDVIRIFELAIPSSERVTNGAVYTPRFIRDYIVRYVFDSSNNQKRKADWLCADISCGCGAFLYTLAEAIKEAEPELTYQNIYHHLYGVDISATSVHRAKILLALLALLHDEDISESDFRLSVGNSLSFNFMELDGVRENNGFDVVVGNPPYVRAKNIDTDSKKLLSEWETSRCGNADLYIPFFELGLSALNGMGMLGYITVNTFFKAVNARSLRAYFSRNRYALKIINFGQELIFEKKLAYTCLAFIDKSIIDGIEYAKASAASIKNSEALDYNHLAYTSLDSHKGWQLSNNIVLENIRCIENAGPALGKTFTIKNGIATLANDIFIFRPISEDEIHYHIQRAGRDYKIEKAICRDIIKPNILKSEEDLERKKEKIIFPYDKSNAIIEEDFFANTYPQAYAYLKDCRDVLESRDKGEGEYPAWYAFGRTQAITDHGIRLFFPYMSDKPHFILSKQDDLLMYCGYAIFLEDERELKVLKRILESSTFDYYIRNTSKPYSTNYFSYAKNYVKGFGIYQFNEEEKDQLMQLSSKESIDDFVARHYKTSMSLLPLH